MYQPRDKTINDLAKQYSNQILLAAMPVCQVDSFGRMENLELTLTCLITIFAIAGAKNKITTESPVCDLADVAEEVATVCSDKCGPYTTDISQQDFNCYAVCALPIMGWEVSNEALDDVEDELMANQDFLDWLEWLNTNQDTANDMGVVASAAAFFAQQCW